MSGPSFGGPASAGLTGLSGPTLGQAAPPSGASGAGMSHSGFTWWSAHVPRSCTSKSGGESASSGINGNAFTYSEFRQCSSMFHVDTCCSIGAWTNSAVA